MKYRGRVPVVVVPIFLVLAVSWSAYQDGPNPPPPTTIPPETVVVDTIPTSEAPATSVAADPGVTGDVEPAPTADGAPEPAIAYDSAECASLRELLTLVDNPELRAAAADVGCV